MRLVGKLCSAVADGLVAVCDVALSVACMLVAHTALLRIAPWRAPSADVQRYCLVAGLCCAILTLCLPSGAPRRSVRTDEIMQWCFRRVLLLFVFTCAATTFVDGMPVAHCLLATFAVAMFLGLLVWRMVLRFCVRLVRRGKTDEEEGQAWYTVELPCAREPLLSLSCRCRKRLFDICLSLLFLLTLFPVVYAVMFCLTKMRRRGAVLVTSRCRGMDGKAFGCVLFHCGGRGIRKLPMFLNVLAGSMSVVGSCAYFRQSREAYLSQIEESAVRRRTKAGITGMWRVGGKPDDGDEEAARLDVWYARNWTLWLDLYVILKTLATRDKANTIYD